MVARRRVAVIGAGLAGLTVARALEDVVPVVVFEKARGVSGRMATRRHDGIVYDHGAQYFTARSPEFRAFLAPWKESGVVQEWKPRLTTLSPGRESWRRFWFEPHLVAVPGMTSWCKDMATSVDVSLSTRIEPLSGDGPPWVLVDTEGASHGPFDFVVSAIPAPQAAVLLPGKFSGMPRIRDTVMTGCFTLLLKLQGDPGWHWDAAVALDSPIGWIARSRSRPGRGDSTGILVHSTNVWAEAHLDADPNAILEDLLNQFVELVGLERTEVVDATCHRWRYAATARSPECGFLLDSDRGLAAVGDWCIGGRVEAAYLSGRRLADALLTLV